MVTPRDDVPDGFEPEEPPKPAADDAGSELWRLLQDEGHMAGGGSGKPVEPAHPTPFPEQPEDRLQLEEMDSWRLHQKDADTTAQDEERASRLRRMIETPEELAAEGFEFEQRGVVEEAADTNGDFDTAVARFNRDTPVIPCRLHPDVLSVAQCPECQAFYCQDCLVVRRGRMLCRDCAQTAFVLSEEEIIRQQAEGIEAPEAGVIAEAPPEFQLGSFGLEGAPASPVKKTLAWLIDFALTRGLLLLVVWLAAMMDLGIAPQAARTVFAEDAEGALLTRVVQSFLAAPFAWLPLIAVIDFLYYFLTQSFFNRTIGMSWTGCRIVTEWGEYVSFGAAAMRSLIFIVCLELPALLASVFMRYFRGPHDLAAGTIEINYSGVKRVDAYETIQLQL